jgi:hypothetical protein
MMRPLVVGMEFEVKAVRLEWAPSGRLKADVRRAILSSLFQTADALWNPNLVQSHGAIL